MKQHQYDHICFRHPPFKAEFGVVSVDDPIPMQIQKGLCHNFLGCLGADLPVRTKLHSVKMQHRQVIDFRQVPCQRGFTAAAIADNGNLHKFSSLWAKNLRVIPEVFFFTSNALH